jgi:hypothetical protein
MMVFLVGHGKWFPKDGYVTLPSQTSLTFYTQNAKLLNTEVAYKIVDGTSKLEPDGKWEAYRTVPNMTLLHFSPDVNEKFRSRAKVRGALGIDYDLFFAEPGSGITLAELVKKTQLLGNDLHWIACRSLQLKEPISGTPNRKRGQSSGVNASESEDFYVFKWTPERPGPGNNPQRVPKQNYR